MYLQSTVSMTLTFLGDGLTEFGGVPLLGLTGVFMEPAGEPPLFSNLALAGAAGAPVECITHGMLECQSKNKTSVDTIHADDMLYQ